MASLVLVGRSDIISSNPSGFWTARACFVDVANVFVVD